MCEPSFSFPIFLALAQAISAYSMHTNFGSYRPYGQNWLRQDSKRMWDESDDSNNLQFFLQGTGHFLSNIIHL